MSDPNDQKIYQFGDFRLIPVEGLLIRGTTPVQLAPKSFEALVLLVERRGHLVGKDELMRYLWADAFVEESAVSKSIWSIRHALGEDSKTSRFIQTVHKRGYRFIANVSVMDGASDLNGVAECPESTRRDDRIEAFEARSPGPTEEPGRILASHPVSPGPNAAGTASTPSSVSGRSVGRRPFRTLTGIILSVVVVIGSLAFYNGEMGKPVKNRVAILPLRGLDPKNHDPLYEFGIADSLILKLGSSRNLAVRQFSSVRDYAGLDRDPVEIGNELKVDYVLDSHYQLEGGRIKVTSQLFRVGSGEVEEPFTVESDATNPFSAQAAVVDQVGDRLLFRFGSPASSYKPARGTNSEEAYRLYLEAMYLYDKRGGNELRRAIGLLDRAVQLDPDYASAWAGKALVSHEYSTPGINSTPKEHKISMDAASKALEIDPNLSDAHTAICQEKLLYEFDFRGAESECRRAVELEPTSPLAHQASSTLFSSRGQFDEAISEIKTAIDLQPASFNSQRFYGNTLYYARRYDEAAAQFERVIAMNPSFRGGYVWLIKALEMKGDEQKAFETLIKYLNTRNTADQKIGDAAQLERFKDAWQSLGWRGVVLERERVFDRSNDPFFRRAEWNARLGDEASVFVYLQKSYELHEWGIAFLRVEPAFDSVRSDPRFNELIAKVESR